MNEVWQGFFQDKELIVEYTLFPREFGRRDSLGVPEEPDWPDMIEVDAVKDIEGKTIDLSLQEKEELEEIIMTGRRGKESADEELFDREDDLSYD